MSVSSAKLLLLLIVMSLISLWAGLSFGAANLSMKDVLLVALKQIHSPMVEQIIWQLRLPRSLLAFIAGAGLALSGLMLQTVTRNPLADPYLFGVSSGASFAVVLAMVVFDVSFYHQQNTFAFGGLSLAAFCGGMVVISLLMLLTRYQSNMHTLVLAGVALSFLFSALTSLMLYFSDPQAITAILFWTLGSFTRANLANVYLALSVLILTLVVVQAHHRQLNTMVMGDETAVTAGIKPNRLRLIMLSVSALMTAVLVAICGGIGFVGLIIPHIVRYFYAQGANLHYVVCAFVGGIFMLWIDILSRLVVDNQELPIGIITAAIGSLFFLMLLVRNNRASNSF